MIDFMHCVEDWGPALVRASWQGSLTLLLVWSLCRWLPAMPARFQSWLWRLAVLKFLVVLVWIAPVEVALLPAVTMTSPDRSETTVPEIASWAAATQEEQSVSVQPSPTLPSLWLLPLVAWIAGVGWQMNRVRKDWRESRLLKHRCHPIRDAAIIAELAAVSKSFGLLTPPTLLETGGKGSPMLIGLLRPTIVIPAITLRRLDAAERTMVLGHEVAHIRRGDLWWNLVAALVRAVFFFHPLVWLVERRLQLAQEIAADELAIAHQRHEPADYGQLLVSVVSKLGPQRSLPALAVGTAGTQQSLKHRIVAMQFMKPTSPRIIVACGIVLTAAGILGLVPWKLVAAEPSAKILKLVKADDFWSQTGAKLSHDDIVYEDKPSLVQLAGNSDEPELRIRAFKLLADFHKRTRYSADFSDEQLLEAVAGAFRYLEKHLNDQVVEKFRPELGFTHVSVSKRSPDQGKMWILIESSDSILPAGGLNIGWNPATKAVDKVEHWGVNRNPSRRPAVSVRTIPPASVASSKKDQAVAVEARASKSSQYQATIKISEGQPGQEKEVIAAPNLVYVAGRKAEFKAGRIEATIESDPSQEPSEHTVQVTITDQAGEKGESRMIAPRITIPAGDTAAIICTNSDGNEVQIVVTVERVKTEK